MAEYIEREAARLAVEQQCVDGKMFGRDESDNTLVDAYDVIDAINEIPAADVSPVVHSYWEHKITNDGENIGICHNCKYPVSWFWEIAKYCPNCEAKMDGGAD